MSKRSAEIDATVFRQFKNDIETAVAGQGDDTEPIIHQADITRFTDLLEEVCAHPDRFKFSQASRIDPRNGTQVSRYRFTRSTGTNNAEQIHHYSRAALPPHVNVRGVRVESPITLLNEKEQEALRMLSKGPSLDQVQRGHSSFSQTQALHSLREAHTFRIAEDHITLEDIEYNRGERPTVVTRAGVVVNQYLAAGKDVYPLSEADPRDRSPHPKVHLRRPLYQKEKEPVVAEGHRLSAAYIPKETFDKLSAQYILTALETVEDEYVQLGAERGL